MRKNRFLSLLLTATMMAAAATSLTACHDDDNGGESPVGPVAGAAFSYQAFLAGADDEMQVTLDSLTSTVTGVECNASWLKASLLPDLDSDGHAVLALACNSADGKEATITVSAENGEKATVTVKHDGIGNGDAYSGGNSTFLTNWWEFTTVELEGFEHPQATPWTVKGADHIPDEVRKQVNPAQGWEMAFCYLNDTSIKGARYMALYNKWTGQVRVYTYIENPAGWGSDLMINAYFGMSTHNDMYPFYNVHEYGIPTNHVLGSNLSRSAKLLDKQVQTFQTWLTPFRFSESVTPGWYCFEFDMSGYVPKGKDWLKKDEDATRFKFFAETINNSEINLKGTLIGDLGGTFSNPEIIQHGGANATSSVFSSLGSMLTGISGMASNSISGGSSYASLMKNGGAEGMGSWLNPTKYWGGFACSVAGGLLSLAGSAMEDPITYDTIPGRIDLTLDAALNINGYMKSITSNSQRGLSVSPEGIYSVNGANGHMGKGVWSLAEDPVVYIDQDDILSTESSFNLQCTSTGYYIGTFQNYNARLVYAFDPTSVKLNINTDLFRDIQDVTVTANVGVFPNQPYGHTDRYRQMLMLGNRPSFRLSSNHSGSININTNQEPFITKLGLDALADGEYETADNCSIVAQKAVIGNDTIAWQRFYGRLIELPEMNKQIIVDPQVFIPYAVDGSGNETSIGFPTAPDFVVRVEVQFSALDDNGKRKDFQFSKLYIPKIVVTDWNGMCNVYKRLLQFQDDSDKGNTINTLANAPGVGVKFPGGCILIDKTIRLLKLICEI